MTGPDGKPLVLFENVFPATLSGKIELKSETLAKRWGAAALLPVWRARQASHPLMLISPSSDKRISSTLGDLAGSRKPPPPLMNPKDAAERGLGHGIDVRIWNDRGEVILPLEVTKDVPPGVVASEKGAWLSTSRTGQTISALVSADQGRSRRRGMLQRHAGRGNARLMEGHVTHSPIALGAGGCDAIHSCVHHDRRPPQRGGHRPLPTPQEWTTSEKLRNSRLFPQFIPTAVTAQLRPVTEVARTRQVALYEHGDDRDGVISSLQDADAVVGRERLFDLAAAVQHAEYADALIAARSIARCLTDELLAIIEAQRSVIFGLELEPDSLE
jgi:hypothetical protein